VGANVGQFGERLRAQGYREKTECKLSVHSDRNVAYKTGLRRRLSMSIFVINHGIRRIMET
jgi:hypothetical protein